jgi:hypothetical protein
MFRRSIIFGLAVLALAVGATSALAGGQGSTQVAGTMLTTACSDGMNIGVDMTGGLSGCWYTDELTCRAQVSGTVQCAGLEHFVVVDSLGGKSGTLYFAYEFSGKYDWSTFAEIRGRCNHRIIGSDGDFAGASGVLHFKDDVTTGQAPYRGNVLL